MDLGTLIELLNSTLRLGTPLLLACLAGLFSERSGVIDIGLEGKMLMAAFLAGAVAAATGNVCWRRWRDRWRCRSFTASPRSPSGAIS